MKFLTTILFGAAMALTLATAQAEDKDYEGTMCCAKCELGTADACTDVLKVGDTLYTLEEDGKVKTSAHKCKGTQPAKVTGKEEDRDGKKFIVVSKIEKG